MWAEMDARTLIILLMAALSVATRYKLKTKELLDAHEKFQKEQDAKWAPRNAPKAPQNILTFKSKCD